MPTEPIRPSFSLLEAALLALSLACVAVAAMVYVGPDPSSSDRAWTLILCLGTFVSVGAFLVARLRRGRAFYRSHPEAR